MSVTPEQVKKVAHLARLAIDESQIPVYTENLNNLLKLVEQMNSVDTTNIEPMSHPLEGLNQRLRKDEITEQNQRELLQRDAPLVTEGLFLVPIVIE